MGSSGEGVADVTDEVGVIDEDEPTTELHPSPFTTILRNRARDRIFPIFPPRTPFGVSGRASHGFDGPALLAALLCAFISSTLAICEVWMCRGARHVPSPPMKSGRPVHSVPFLQKVPKFTSNLLCGGCFPRSAPGSGEGDLDRPPMPRYVGGFTMASNSACDVHNSCEKEHLSPNPHFCPPLNFV